MALGNIGKYEKLDVLGHGASGIVYLAWDSLLGKHVALKEISLQAADEGRFLEEARVLDRLRHPNIVRVNSVDRIDGCMMIDMEYVKGTNLHEYMRRKGKLSLQEALGIAVQVCDALDFAHRNRAVHRDIKPANILISREGEAKIVDFGLAEILGSGSYAGGAGTYAYMSPEDFEEEERSDHRSDIWAAGVTLYEMLTGRRPFQAAKAKDPFSWKRAVGEDEPVPLCDIDPSLPGELEEVLVRALAKNKYDRYQSAGEMRDDLKRILASAGGPVRLGLHQMKRSLPVDDTPSVQAVSDISVEPDEVYFGNIREGESGSRKLTVRVPGRGRIIGRAARQPGWLTVSPQAFSRRKQVLFLYADTHSIRRPGGYDDHLILEVDGEKVTVPVSVSVLPHRRRFYEVGWWYVPLFALCILPAIVRYGTLSAGGRPAEPSGLIAAGLLSIMLFIISMAADLGIVERLLPAAVGVAGLGAAAGAVKVIVTSGRVQYPEGFMLASVLSLILALQLLTISRWRAWALVLALCSVSATVVLKGSGLA